MTLCTKFQFTTQTNKQGICKEKNLFIYLFIYRFVQCTGERAIGHVVPYLVHPPKSKSNSAFVNKSVFSPLSYL